MILKRTWVTAITKRISTTAKDGRRLAVQQTVHGNWYGYVNGKRAMTFFSYDNNEVGAVTWMKKEGGL